MGGAAESISASDSLGFRIADLAAYVVSSFGWVHGIVIVVRAFDERYIARLGVENLMNTSWQVRPFCFRALFVCTSLCYGFRILQVRV